MTIVAGSVAGPTSGGAVRPNIIRVVSGGVTTDYDNPLGSTDGAEWDHIVLPVSIPAGATSLTIQLLSEDCCATGALPASMTWISSALSIFEPVLGQIGDTVFCDANDNGTQDPGEPGVPGVQVELLCTLLDGSSFPATQLTGPDGRYLFVSVPEGSCAVSIDLSTIPADKEVGQCPTEQ